MQQVFIDRSLDINDRYEFDEHNAHHLKNVLKIKKDTIIRLVYQDSYLAKIEYDNNKIYARVIEIDNNVNELDCEVILVQSLIRKDNFELVLQKACELGVSKIIPLISSRCVALDKNFDVKKLRYQKIMKSACEQSKRNNVAVIDDVCTINELDVDASLKMVAFENEKYSASKISQLYDKQKSIVIVIGPEGGFSDDEIKVLTDKGYQCVSLGSRILRSETASLYALSVLGEIIE
ncbi:MAG: 16S rRNA (uracil(1498)-N(3))-methyltransferase [Firmicutes bacterium]|nr:16S rRNA (uracil(1498)-N(3))-methyltransferase [Erysipelotrichaceae bacterium]MDD6526183.1 16S rRNA (uracil(1498)-N(3))-methyltransferase [Bacillota bacterium]